MTVGLRHGCIMYIYGWGHKRADGKNLECSCLLEWKQWKAVRVSSLLLAHDVALVVDIAECLQRVVN